MSFIIEITKVAIVCVVKEPSLFKLLDKAEIKTFESPIEDLKHWSVCLSIASSLTLKNVVHRHVGFNLLSSFCV